MRITGLACDFINDGSRNWPIVRVMTDSGITGIGEAYPVGPDKAVAETVRYFEEWLLGFDPFDGERIWHELYAGSRFPTGSVITAAISGIDQALWDIKGKALETPVYQLLGGKVRDRVRVYQSAGGHTPEAWPSVQRGSLRRMATRRSRSARPRQMAMRIRGAFNWIRPSGAWRRCAKPWATP